MGSGEASNCISGKIRFGDETLATVSGHWDQEVFIKDKRSEVRALILKFCDLLVYDKSCQMFDMFTTSDCVRLSCDLHEVCVGIINAEMVKPSDNQ